LQILFHNKTTLSEFSSEKFFFHTHDESLFVSKERNDSKEWKHSISWS